MAITGLTDGQPLELLKARVQAGQTNAQGHLRAAQYVQLFDDAVMVFFPLTGLADADLRHGETSPFLMDLHTCYLAELRAGDAVTIKVQHLEHDARRARLIMSMHDDSSGRLAATTELLLINMGLTSRRPAPWSPEQLAIWQSLRAAHQSLPAPAQAGRAIGSLTS